MQLQKILARVSFMAMCLSVAVSAVAGQKEHTTMVTRAETIQISGFIEGWEAPLTDQLRFDACHRRLLVRFPGAAEKIADQLEEGYRIQKAELLLPFKKTEVFPEGYAQRHSFGVKKMYHEVRPNWHAVAWPLRHPWTADEDLAPTFNAWIRGTAYWSRPGADDPQEDRFPRMFGPTRVSIFQARGINDPMVGKDALSGGKEYALHANEQPDHQEAIVEDPEAATPARMDVTAVLREKQYGQTLGERLRQLAECGFMVKKWETYDFRFRGKTSYPWGVSIGGRAIVIHPPRLEVAFAPAEARSVALPEPTGMSSLARRLKGSEEAGQAPLTMPSTEEIARRLKEAGFHRRLWMTDWQWGNIKQLRDLGVGNETFPQTPEEYEPWIRKLLAEQPRYWGGWDQPVRLLTYFRYAQALPQYVRKHYFQDYWTAWLRPDTPTSELVHPWCRVSRKRPGQADPNTYYRKTGDWRGNASYYRGGFNYNISTMNFNHTAAMGALLGGEIINSEYAMADGRHGLENYPMRLWSWYDGSTQESIDHYYLALTLVAQKMFADYGPRHIDRMMGRSILAKTVGELASAYHPHLRHFLASSSRTNVPDYLLAKQGGVQSILHTLSPEGTLHDLDASEVPDGMDRFGKSVSPMEVQEMSMTHPWAPAWYGNVIDYKPLPFEMTCAYKVWGRHAQHPLWRRTHLGENYGLASTDITTGEVQILGHWRRKARPVSRVQELGMMDVWYGINEMDLAGGQHHRRKRGMQAALQHKNKIVVVTSPQTKHIQRQKRVSKLISTIAFYNYEEPEVSWELYVDGNPVDSLPVEAEAGQRITIHDGLTYIGVVPLPAADLGGGGITLRQPDPQKSYSGSTTQAALAIESYNMRLAEPLGGDELDSAMRRRMDQAYGGWIIEYADATEFDSFTDFQQHMDKSALETKWDGESSVMHVRYSSGEDTMKLGVNTLYEGGSTDDLFTRRTVNGRWPYLQDGLLRDTTLVQQGRSGELEKNGAVLRTEGDTMSYLQTEPKSGTYVGWNPLPDLSFFGMDLPEDVRVRADGRVGITRVMVRPAESVVRVDHALKDAQKGRPDLASAMFFAGLPAKPRTSLNDQDVPGGKIGQLTIEGKKFYYVPLTDQVPAPEKLKARYRAVQDAIKARRGADSSTADSLFRDWHVVGPFPVENTYPEEMHVDVDQLSLDASYEGAGGGKVTWQRVVSEGKARFGRQAVDLKNVLKGPNKDVCAYAVTTIESSRERDGVLYVGSDDSVTVWLNGEKVLAVDATRAAHPDQNVASVHLKKGRNLVLVRVGQRSGGWEFYFRLANAFGVPLTDGVKYEPPIR